MTIIYNRAEVRELDRLAIEEYGIPGIQLMRRAAEACVGELVRHWPSPGPVAVFCGSGNNAGDGFIIAGLLKMRGIDVCVTLVGSEPAEGSDAASALAFMQDNQVPLLPAEEAINGAGLIVDALLGTGITGAVRPAFAEVIEMINASSSPVLAVDLPSGLDADTGFVASVCVRADVTVTFIGRKMGLETNDGPEFTGQLCFAGLDVPVQVLQQVSGTATRLDYHELAERLPVRHRNAHKHRHGHLLVIGGDEGMAGAVAMCAEAALYAGAGMVTVLTHESSVPVVVNRRPEVMARGLPDAQELADLMARASSIVMGPGLGRSDWSRQLFRLAMETDLPMVVDADGLNLVAEGEPPARRNWILTPHPGEASRLVGLDVQADRLAAIRAVQSRYGGQVLLKGAGTLILDDEERLYLNPYGNPGMSVAGMGDVLSGVIGALLAQGLPASLATRLGCVVHSLAADQRVREQGERGLLATELMPGIRRLLNPGF